jgi:hypothetical protein
LVVSHADVAALKEPRFRLPSLAVVTLLEARAADSLPCTAVVAATSSAAEEVVMPP